MLLVSAWDLRILPFSVTLGYTLPSVLMALPSPTIVSPKAHQKYIALWQAFPIWTVIIHYLLKTILPYASAKFRKSDAKSRPQSPLGASYLTSVKPVYIFVLTMCITTHIPVLMLTLTPSWLIPPITFPVLSRLSQQSLASVYIPYFPSPSYQVSSLAEGVHNFLLWDLYVGSAALLLWAIYLYCNATTKKATVDPNTSLPVYRELLLGDRVQDGILWRKIVWKMAIWGVFGGPIGALAVILWERDTIVRQKIKLGV